MTKYDTSPTAIARRLDEALTRLDNAIARAKADRQKLKELIAQAEIKLTNHGERIAQNESDIETGRLKLVDHETRIEALENP
jgi:chromosome segregation ATPase